MPKASFNKKKNLFASKLDLNLRKKLVNYYILSIDYMIIWCLKLDTSDSGFEIPGKF